MISNINIHDILQQWDINADIVIFYRLRKEANAAKEELIIKWTPVFELLRHEDTASQYYMLDYPSIVMFQEDLTMVSLTDICKINQLLNRLQGYERKLEVEVTQDASNHGSDDGSLNDWQDPAGDLTDINEDIL